MVAIYARQSVEKRDSLSIQGQVELCQKESSENAVIYQDKGYSGKNTRRPDFERMLRDVTSGKISKIIVYRLDRFSRSIADFGNLWEVLQSHGVEFVSVNEKFDTTAPMGRAMLHIIMVFAQLERETIAERVKDNYYQRAALGAWPGGPAPYGFSIGRLQDATGRKVPTLLENGDMSVVRRIFEVYALEASSLGSLARVLNADAVPAPRRTTWDNVCLSRILHSPLYVCADQEVMLYFKSKGAIFTVPNDAFDGTRGAMLVGKRDRTAGKYQDVKEQKLSLANHEGMYTTQLQVTGPQWKAGLIHKRVSPAFSVQAGRAVTPVLPLRRRDDPLCLPPGGLRVSFRRRVWYAIIIKGTVKVPYSLSIWITAPVF